VENKLRKAFYMFTKTVLISISITNRRGLVKIDKKLSQFRNRINSAGDSIKEAKV
jgi:hypothetical protein